MLFICDEQKRGSRSLFYTRVFRKKARSKERS